MANDYYDHTTFPATGSARTSAGMRAELDTVEAAFDKLPALGAGNGLQAVFVNTAGTALESVAASTARSRIGAAASGANADITSVALNNSGLTVKDTNSSHVLVIRPGSDLTANRNLDFATGDADRVVTISGDANISGTMLGAASQSQQEAGSSTSVFVSPGRQQYHPSAAKAWAIFDGTGSVSVAASYNLDGVTPITDNGTGDYTLNWGTDFSSANCSVIATCFWETTSSNCDQVVHVGIPVAGAWQINTVAGTNGVKTDNRRICIAAFGDQ